MSPSFSGLNLVFLGPPGSGKGTQARLMAERFCIPHISTGDLLRDEVQRGTTMGEQARASMETGGLVPDQVMAGLILARLDKEDSRRGFLLNGYPRNVEQAGLLDGILAELGRVIERVVLFRLADDLIVERLAGRFVHPASGRSYHPLFNPPAANGMDDQTGEPLVKRDDDSEVLVRERLRVYHRSTAPLVELYRARGQLLVVDGCGRPSEVADHLQQMIGTPVSV